MDRGLLRGGKLNGDVGIEPTLKVLHLLSLLATEYALSLAFDR